MSALILRALTDDDFYQSLKSHAVAQSAKFSWDETARRTWRGLQDMVARLQATIRGAGDTAAGRHELMEAIAEVTHDHAPTDAEILDLARSIEANEQATNRLRASAAFSGPLTWRIEGPFDSTYSLAVINREAARALTLLGHEIVLHSTEGPGDFAADERFLTRNPDLEAMHRRVSRFPHEAVDVVSRNLYPPRVGDMRGRTNLLHNYAWEESAFPVQWTRWFNQHLNGIGCVSRHVRKTLGDDGVTVPMAVIGNGVDHWDRIDANPSFAVEARRFRFLHVSSCFPRKGIDVLLNAYGEAFTIDDDVSVVIKTFPNPHNDTNALLAAHRSRNARYPHVVLLEGDLSDSDLKALYGDCHALVAPSRAEGFGLPIAEAMLSGLSVIVTGWSGQLDFCNDETAWLVDYSFAPAASHFDLFDSVWAEPDVGHLARTMSVVSRTGPAERQRKSSAARGILLENFQWRDVMARLVLFARSCGSPGYWRTHPPRIGWMSTWNTQCGIASYSEHLLSGFPGPVTVFAPRDGLRVRADGPDCIRSWFSGKQENGFPELTREIERRAVDLLVVQFNYGLFNFRQLDEFICGQAALRPVIVIMHSTGDPGLSPAWNWTLAGLIPAFSLCQRVLVHSIHDLNALKALGLVANVTLFPHAVLDIAAPPAIAASEGRPQLLCTYGFCLPHKGLIELLHAVALMHRSGTAVRLRLVNAEYPASVSAALIEQIAALVDELELTDHVETHHGYLTDEESCGLLRDADLIVYPYQSTQESASGAVRFGIAVHRPVAVTPLAVFADLGNAVHRLPGVSPADMARGMTAVLSELSMGSDAAKSIESQAEKWRASHTYAALAARLHALCLTALPENMRTHWRFDASSRRVESHVGRIDGRSIRSTTVDGYLASGPKLALMPGSYRVIVTGSCNPSGVADDHVDVSVDGCRRILARLSLDASKQPTIVDGIVMLEERCRDLRVRLFVSGRSEVRVDSIEIARVAAACI
jgi:glycosyltransferase involved in cell wall biosynthesis